MQPSGCKDIGIRRFEFVAKTQFLYLLNLNILSQLKNKDNRGGGQNKNDDND